MSIKCQFRLARAFELFTPTMLSTLLMRPAVYWAINTGTCLAGQYVSSRTCYPCQAGLIAPGTGYTSVACAGASTVQCPIGSYCPAGSSARTPCTAGSACTSAGLAAPNAVCVAGYYCPSGSSSTTQVRVETEVSHVCDSG